MRKIIPLVALVLFMGQAKEGSESIPQMEARLKSLKTEVATLEQKLATARAKESPAGVELASVLEKIPPRFQWRSGESARARAERGDWIVEQVKGQQVKCRVVLGRAGNSGALEGADKYPCVMGVTFRLAVGAAEKSFEGDTLEIQGTLASADFIPVKQAYSKFELTDAVVLKVLPKR